ncbi:helix-turn-helix domain-containing protein [Actinomadura madurae]|uniref:helix-turn-helix domain-containing protein n=1 Tax=Actinomadura madurae TaxID=1993 RepID=UPI0020D22F59|nr:transcriptional regulator [Actinomadura madurae]MCP9980792.1 helix-turn-helix domain-containing protein [Actinomadura madurae]
MSRTRPPTPLPGDLPEAVRVLLIELRGLKEESGLDLRALERRTHASRSSWGRWLSGETWIPADAVASLADLCGADAHRLAALWEVADEARRAAPPTPAGTTGTADTIDRANTRDTAATVSAPSEPPPHRTGGTAACCSWAPSSPARSSPGRPGSPSAPPCGRRPSPGTRAAARPARPASPSARSAARTSSPAAGAGIRTARGGCPTTRQPATRGTGRTARATRRWRSGSRSPAPTPRSWRRPTARQIPMPSLRPGDLVIKSSGGADVREVLIFERWTSGARTAYWAYQQRRGYGTDHLVRRDGLARGSDHRACRPRNIQDDPVG